MQRRKQIDVVLPSHYHDDRVCGLQYLHQHHGAGLWVFENQAGILAHPEAYKIPCLWDKIPCLWEKPMAADRVFGEGETFSWRGTTFTATRTPGHTGALRIEPAFLDEALVRARSLDDILWGLIAVPEAAGFACDPNWATLYPYQTTARPGETITVTVRIVNYLRTATMARAELRLPEGWTGEALVDDVEIGGEPGDLRFTVRAPEAATVGERHVITATVTLGERRFGPVAEGIIQVVA